MKYFYIEPEVAGGIGEHSLLDHTPSGPRVTKLHYVFDGWLGDALVEGFPCFIVTLGGKEAIEAADLTGVEFDMVEVGKSQQFDDLHPGRELPQFAWMKIAGQIGLDDFVMASDRRLLVSDRALDVLNALGVRHAEIEAFSTAPSN